MPQPLSLTPKKDPFFFFLKWVSYIFPISYMKVEFISFSQNHFVTFFKFNGVKQKLMDNKCIVYLKLSSLLKNTVCIQFEAQHPYVFVEIAAFDFSHSLYKLSGLSSTLLIGAFSQFLSQVVSQSNPFIFSRPIYEVLNCCMKVTRSTWRDQILVFVESCVPKIGVNQALE